MKLSLVQYPLAESLSFAAFCEKMRSLLTEPADVHVFPELHSAELLSPAARSGEKEGEEWHEIAAHFDAYVEFVRALAEEKNALIVGGTFPRKTDGVLRNTCVIARPAPEGGTEAILQEKLYPTQIERTKWLWQGGNQVQVIEHRGFKIVTLVCYDVEFPQVSELLTQIRPHLVIVPSCTSAHYGYNRVRWCAQARAIEHFAFVAATGTVGSLATSPSFAQNEGQAYVLSPSEVGYPRIVAEGPMNRALQLLTELDLATLEKDRARVGAYPARDQVEFAKRIVF